MKTKLINVINNYFQSRANWKLKNNAMYNIQKQDNNEKK